MEELGVKADEWKLMTLSIGANDVVSQISSRLHNRTRLNFSIVVRLLSRGELDFRRTW